MKVLFFASSNFSVPFINAVYNSRHSLSLIVTNPDVKTGRGKKIAPNPVKVEALNLGIPFYELENFDDCSIDFIRSGTFDIIAAVSYGKIIPSELLGSAHGKTVNVHPSILPKYRGPSPIATVLLNGENITGVCLIKIDKTLDTGDIYELKKIPVLDEDNYSSLEEKIIKIATKMLTDFLDRFEQDEVCTYPQPGTGVSYTRIFTRKDTVIDWNDMPGNIINRIRAFSCQPGCSAAFRDRIVKILKAKTADPGPTLKKANFKPGEVASAGKEGLVIKCGKTVNDFINLELIQPEGKRIMNWRDFINGYRVKNGDLFG